MKKYSIHFAPGLFRLCFGVVLVGLGLDQRSPEAPLLVFMGQIFVLFGVIRLAVNPLINQNREIIDLLKRQQASGHEDTK